MHTKILHKIKRRSRDKVILSLQVSFNDGKDMFIKLICAPQTQAVFLCLYTIIESQCPFKLQCVEKTSVDIIPVDKLMVIIARKDKVPAFLGTGRAILSRHLIYFLCHQHL